MAKDKGLESLELTDTAESGTEVRAGGKLLFRYVHQPATDPLESPRPFIHPLKTLAGWEVTDFRPEDHPWHHGLSMTSANLSGENFWGGATFVPGEQYAHLENYVQLDNNGVQRHEGWDKRECSGGKAELTHRLAWITRAGERWLEERRRISVAELDEAAGFWSLDISISLRNVSGRELAFGSPTTKGRPDAGYGGLIWRGSPSFNGGTVLASAGKGGAGMMGQRSPWLAYSGAGWNPAKPEATLVFLDHPANPRHPTKWFVRNTSTPLVSFAFMFDEELKVKSGDSLDLRYRVVIANGGWTRERVESYAGGLKW